MSKRTTVPKREMHGDTFAVSVLPTTTQSFTILYDSQEARETFTRIVGRITLSATTSITVTFAIIRNKDGTNATSLQTGLVAVPAYPDRPEDVLGLWRINIDEKDHVSFDIDLKGMRKLRKNDTISLITKAGASGAVIDFGGKLFTKLV